MSTELARQQLALLNALWAPDLSGATHYIANYIDNTRGRALKGASNTVEPVVSERAARGLQAYRSHGRELAVRALAGAYPVVAQLLGDDNFAGLAKALWQAHPRLLWGMWPAGVMASRRFWPANLN